MKVLSSFSSIAALLPLMETDLPTTNVPGTKEQWATRAFFFIAGLAASSWAPLVPYAKQRLELDEAALGWLLLCLGAGSLFLMPITAFLTGKYGCRKVILTVCGFLCAALVLLSVVGSVFWMALTLLLFGAVLGTLDVAMNINAIMVQKACLKPMMSGFHGLYSIGGFAGAGLVSILLAVSLPPYAAISCMAGVILLLMIFFGKNLLQQGSGEKTELFVLPRGLVLLIGILCFIVFLAEGSMLDWSALFLTTVKNMPQEHAGFGYSVFALFMTGGRMTGDRLCCWLGYFSTLMIGALLAMGGFILALVTPQGGLALAGFAMIGLGLSNVVPILSVMAGSQKSMPAGPAIASVTTIGYAGILAGPAAIGFIAHHTSLSLSLGLVAFLLLFLVFFARKVTRPA